MFADLADRRAVAAAADLLANEVIDALLPLGQLVERFHTNPLI